MKFKLVAYVFSFIGLAVLLFAMNSYIESKEFLAKALSTKGEVVALERSTSGKGFAPRIRFIDDQASTVEFTSNISRNPPGYAVGDQVDVIYSEGGQQDARIKSFFSLWGGALIMAVIGSLLFIPGVAFIGLSRRKARNRQYLRQHGLVVEANIESVERNHRLEVNGRNPFVIVCHWRNPATHEVHRLESENIWYDPSEYISTTKAKVFIDKQNPRKYHIDLSFLPKLAD